MNSFRVKVFDGRAKYLVAAIAMLLVTIMPALASADQVTLRSIEQSSSSASATNVTYTVHFTSVKAAGAFVVDFCTVTPLYGEDCATPAGFDVGTPSTDSTFTVAALDTNTVRATGTIAAATPISVDFKGIKNPTDSGPLYARIVTFDTEANANDYVSNPVEPAVNDGVKDTGGVALYITPTIGVSGAVLESMTFCVSGEDPQTHDSPITASCGGTLTPPTVKLGTVVGDATVLDSAQVYEGKVYTQISTNAVSGAIVSLKSNTLGCGGLSRAGATDFAAGCGIGPALAAGITQGQALFGVKTGTAVGVPSVSDGTYQAAGASAYYNDTTFKMKWVSGDATGVTSPYGDPFLDTAGGPVNNMGMPITFGASAANNTPAGRYSADLSLIATGKF